MSLLRRTGNGRNNIDWNGNNTTAGKYLRRTNTGINNISWLQISSNGTHNLLNRTGTGRTNILWKNTTFNFFNFSDYPLDNSKGTQIKIQYYKNTKFYTVSQYLSNGWQILFKNNNTSSNDHTHISAHVFNSYGDADNFCEAIKSHFNKVQIITEDESSFTISHMDIGASSYTYGTYQATIDSTDDTETYNFEQFILNSKTNVYKILFSK